MTLSGDTDLALRLISPPWTYVIDRLDHEPGQWAEEALCLPDVQRHPLAALTHIAAGWGAAGAADTTTPFATGRPPSRSRRRARHSICGLP